MFPIVAPAGGTTFQFFGMTSTNPITEIQFSSVEGTPNLNLVLDNFLVASRPPVPPTALQFQRTSDGLVLSWPGCGFTLQTATAITGPFAGLPGATSPYTNSFAGPAKFFRLKTN
jgi:hypothetical protein